MERKCIYIDWDNSSRRFVDDTYFPYCVVLFYDSTKNIFTEENLFCWVGKVGTDNYYMKSQELVAKDIVAWLHERGYQVDVKGPESEEVRTVMIQYEVVIYERSLP